MNWKKYAALSLAALGATIVGRRFARAKTRGTTSAPSTGSWGDCDFAEFGFGAEEASRIPQYIGIAEDSAREFGVDPNLVLGTIHVESKFNPRATSSAGAIGLMQLLPNTARELAQRLGIPNQPFDPRSNIRMGTAYLDSMLRVWDGDHRMAAASFFAGLGNVKKALDQGGLSEKTESYAAAVLSAERRFERARSACS